MQNKGLVPFGASTSDGILYLCRILLSPLDYKALALIHQDPSNWRILDPVRVKRLAHDALDLDGWARNVTLQYEMATYLHACYARERCTVEPPIALAGIFPPHRSDKRLAATVYIDYYLDTSLDDENKRTIFLMACRSSTYGTRLKLLPNNVLPLDASRPRAVRQYKPWNLLDYFDTVYTSMLEYAGSNTCVPGNETSVLDMYLGMLQWYGLPYHQSRFCTKFFWRLMSQNDKPDDRVPKRVNVRSR